VDARPGNNGSLVSYNDFVALGSTQPPSPALMLNIADGSVLEGNRGTTRLNLTVTLSRSDTNWVYVNYATFSGTALAKSDYTATSGTLAFLPGETKRTISIAIKGDRKRELNETFTVRLSNPSGADINDGVATATILNDD
jgi:hypothetical protein